MAQKRKLPKSSGRIFRINYDSEEASRKYTYQGIHVPIILSCGWMIIKEHHAAKLSRFNDVFYNSAILFQNHKGQLLLFRKYRHPAGGSNVIYADKHYRIGHIELCNLLHNLENETWLNVPVGERMPKGHIFNVEIEERAIAPKYRGIPRVTRLLQSKGFKVTSISLDDKIIDWWIGCPANGRGKKIPSKHKSRYR